MTKMGRKKQYQETDEQKKEPFLVHKNWVGDGTKHAVTYYPTLKSKTVTQKKFKSYADAKEFAIKKARSAGSKTIMVETGTGEVKTLKVPKKDTQKTKKRRKKKDPWAWTKKL